MSLVTRFAGALVIPAVMLVACAQQGTLGSSTAEPSRPTRSAPPLATIPASDEPVTGEVPGEIMAPILADAADRSGTAEDGIEVVQAESITWNDGSLGCPEPGMFYTQALVDGYHVILEAGGEELDYRVTADGSFRLCEDGGSPSGG